VFWVSCFLECFGCCVLGVILGARFGCHLFGVISVNLGCAFWGVIFRVCFGCHFFGVISVSLGMFYCHFCGCVLGAFFGVISVSLGVCFGCHLFGVLLGVILVSFRQVGCVFWVSFLGCHFGPFGCACGGVIFLVCSGCHFSVSFRSVWVCFLGCHFLVSRVWFWVSFLVSFRSGVCFGVSFWCCGWRCGRSGACQNRPNKPKTGGLGVLFEVFWVLFEVFWVRFEVIWVFF